MKVRNGFVSNSSSSSFLIYGITLEGGDAVQLIVNNREKLNKHWNQNYTEDDLYEYLDEDGIYEAIDAIGSFIGKNITTECIGEWDNQVYIGRDYYSLGEDETGKQFKDSAEKTLKDFGLDVSQIGNYSEAYHC